MVLLAEDEKICVAAVLRGSTEGMVEVQANFAHYLGKVFDEHSLRSAQTHGYSLSSDHSILDLLARTSL